MKKIIIALLRGSSRALSLSKGLAVLTLAALLLAAAAVQTTTEGVVIFSSTTDSDGIVTTISFGRVQSARDGTRDLTVFPRVVVTTPSGRVIRDELLISQGFNITLTEQQAGVLNTSIKAAYDAAHP